MNSFRSLQVALIAAASLVSLGSFNPAKAADFETQEVNTNNFAVLSTPVNGNNQHQLLILEQLTNKRPCWAEGSTPGTVEPLLLKFDFTGICSRSVDSNGYSIRMGGQDLGLDYLLRLMPRDGKLILVGSNRVNRQIPDIEVGSTTGISSDGFDKITLNPGWRLTRRTYQGKPLGHIYITSDSATPPLTPTDSAPLPETPAPEPSPVTPENTTPAPLPGTPQSQPPDPQRELIFTKPQNGSVAPKINTPTTNQMTLPGFVVPTRPQSSLITPPSFPTTGNPTVSAPTNLERQIPSFVVPTN